MVWEKASAGFSVTGVPRSTKAGTLKSQKIHSQGNWLSSAVKLGLAEAVDSGEMF